MGGSDQVGGSTMTAASYSVFARRKSTNSTRRAFPTRVLPATLLKEDGRDMGNYGKLFVCDGCFLTGLFKVFLVLFQRDI